MPTVFISAAVRDERLHNGATLTLPGRTRWSALLRLYRAGLIASGWQVRMVDRPEIYQTEAAREMIGVAEGDWHLCIKPLSDIRPFHSLPNLFVLDWEYPQLAAERAPLAPFLDQVGLLARADAVVCTNAFSAAVARRHGLAGTFVLPPYVPSPAPPDVTEPPRKGRRSEPGTTFLCILDADRLSRPLRPLLEGFAAAQAALPTALRLLVHIEGANPDVALPLWNAAVAATGLGRVDGVHLSFTSDPLDDDAASHLFAEANFFLSCCPAEGLPLSIIRAARAGLPVVATVVGGTTGLMPTDAMIPILSVEAPVDEAAEPLAAFMRLTWSLPAPEAVRDAILRAAHLEEAQARRMADTAAAAMRAVVGREAFAAGQAALHCHMLRLVA